MRISIDCWGTLLKSSPTFSTEKIELVNRYTSFVYSDKYISECFLLTKKTFNDIIENSGGCQPHIENIFIYFFTKLYGNYISLNFIKEFIHDYQQLAIRSSPILYSDETIDVIKKMSLHHELIISSNTMLISGNTLEICLNNVGLGKYFTHFNFSDRMGLAKPNKAMYSSSDYHIGDNTLTDSKGAEIAGSKPIIINSNENTIQDAYNIILQGR